MNNKLKLSAFSFLCMSILFACSKKEEVNPQQIEGKWAVQTIESSIETKSDGKSSELNNVTQDSVYYIFNSDGSFETTFAFSAADQNTEILPTPSKGTYILEGQKVILTQFDSDLEADVQTSFSILNKTDTSFELNLTKDEFIKTLNTYAKNSDSFTALIIQTIIDNIVSLNVKVSLQKV